MSTIMVSKKLQMHNRYGKVWMNVVLQYSQRFTAVSLAYTELDLVTCRILMRNWNIPINMRTDIQFTIYYA
jgi:hypothetical protein